MNISAIPPAIHIYFSRSKRNDTSLCGSVVVTGFFAGAAAGRGAGFVAGCGFCAVAMIAKLSKIN